MKECKAGIACVSVAMCFNIVCGDHHIPHDHREYNQPPKEGIVEIITATVSTGTSKFINLK